MTTAAGIQETEAFSPLLAGPLADGDAAPGTLGSLRKRGREVFLDQGLPTARMEEWRFTNIAPVARTQFDRPAPTAEVDAATLTPYHQAEAPLVVLVNGRLSKSLSDLSRLPDGVTLTGLDGAGESLERLGALVDIESHPFAALNTALFEDGMLLDVADGVAVEEPLFVLSLAVPEEHPTALFPRLFVHARANSQVTMVEQHLTLGRDRDGGGTYLTAPVTEFELEHNAVVDHYRVQRESLAANHLGLTTIHQDRSSAFASHAITWGGAIVRNDVITRLDGEGADAILNGLYMCDGNQLVDNHMRVEHVQPNTTSHELYKGILDGRSRSVFNGRIYVHPGAQKTDAKQSNRNLLLSEDAIANSNPQLEIFADDVKCTHGSTTGQLDPLALFYLRSRGIGEVAARSLLTYAFASDIVSRVRVEKTRVDLEEVLFRRLPRGEVVRQAV